MLKRSLIMFTLAFVFVSGGMLTLPAFGHPTPDTVNHEQQDDKMKSDTMAGDKMMGSKMARKPRKKHRKHRKQRKHAKMSNKMSGDKMSDGMMKKP